MGMENQIMVRLPSELREQALKTARAEGKTLSQVVRDLLESYVRERDIKGYAEALWNRIGKALREKGVTESDIKEAIQWARKSKKQES